MDPAGGVATGGSRTILSYGTVNRQEDGQVRGGLQPPSGTEGAGPDAGSRRADRPTEGTPGRGSYDGTVNTTAEAVPDTATDRNVSWYARPVGTAWVLLVTGLLGMYGTVMLVMERVMLWNDPNHITSCDINPWVSCGEVMKTWQSQLFNFPNQFIGMVAFPIVLTIAMALFARARFARWYWIGMNIGVLAGFVFVVWLWSQAVYDINILCLYCMIVWAGMIPMFVLLTSRNLQHGVIPATPAVRKFAAEWAWPLIVLLYVGVLASIMLRFSNAFF
jgi:uncharacterized membrane protein